MVRDCSVAASLGVVGELWSLLALREVFLGVRRFEAIQANTGAPRAVLVKRLNSLVEAGVLERRDYKEPGARVRQEYRLTTAGRELQPVLTALMQWGDKYLPTPSGPPLVVTHAGCGAAVRSVLCCAAGHQLDDAGRELTATPGTATVE